MSKKENHRILLIEPPFYRLFHPRYSLDKYPLSMGYLAAAIKTDTDWDVQVYNADFSPNSIPVSVAYLAGAGFDQYLDNIGGTSGNVWKEVRQTILDYEPSVIGISSKSQNFESASLVAEIAKDIDEDIAVITGGPHPTIMGPDVMSRKAFDIGVRGEGEKTIVELLDVIHDRESWSGIAGIYYRENGAVVNTGQREYLDDLDKLPFPNLYAEQVLRDYRKYPKVAFGYLFANRGCPFTCWFCGSRYIWSRKVRYRSPENVVSEMNTLLSRGLRSIHFDDDTFGVSRKYIYSLCEEISWNAPKSRWSCELHVKLVEDDLIKTMKESGCHSISIGIESGNNDILKKIGKGVTIEESIEACRIINKHNISLNAFFMVGFPWETEETLKDTVDAIRKIRGEITYSIFTPFPGTEAFSFCQEQGLISENYNTALHNAQSPKNCFCLNIEYDRFRELASDVESEVDGINLRYRREKMKNMPIGEILLKLREVGLLSSVRKIPRFFFRA